MRTWLRFMEAKFPKVCESHLTESLWSFSPLDLFTLSVQQFVNSSYSFLTWHESGGSFCSWVSALVSCDALYSSVSLFNFGDRGSPRGLTCLMDLKKSCWFFSLFNVFTYLGQSGNIQLLTCLPGIYKSSPVLHTSTSQLHTDTSLNLIWCYVAPITAAQSFMLTLIISTRWCLWSIVYLTYLQCKAIKNSIEVVR